VYVCVREREREWQIERECVFEVVCVCLSDSVRVCACVLCE